MNRSVFARAGTWILDGQAGMSKEGGLRILAAIVGAQSAEQSAFMNSDACLEIVVI